jgi:hypothetical protein
VGRGGDGQYGVSERKHQQKGWLGERERGGEQGYCIILQGTEDETRENGEQSWTRYSVRTLMNLDPSRNEVSDSER